MFSLMNFSPSSIVCFNDSFLVSGKTKATLPAMMADAPNITRGSA